MHHTGSSIYNDLSTWIKWCTIQYKSKEWTFNITLLMWDHSWLSLGSCWCRWRWRWGWLVSCWLAVLAREELSYITNTVVHNTQTMSMFYIYIYFPTVCLVTPLQLTALHRCVYVCSTSTALHTLLAAALDCFLHVLGEGTSVVALEGVAPASYPQWGAARRPAPLAAPATLHPGEGPRRLAVGVAARHPVEVTHRLAATRWLN